MLKDIQIRDRLTLFWLVFLLNILFHHLHETLHPGFLQDILGGTLNETALSKGGLLSSGLFVQMTILMLLVNQIAHASVARLANLIIAPSAVALIWLSQPGDWGEYLIAAAGNAALIATFLIACTWRPEWVSYSAATRPSTGSTRTAANLNSGIFP